MINFVNLRYQNFLSTGNAFTELKLNAAPTTLVWGQNGAGKSTMIEAICFALFGKPYRNILKSQIPNSINGKNCVVEVEFVVGSIAYMVRRGIKPNVFEIYADGELLNQDAAVKDYQKFLEESILKLNYKSFTQIVVLGSASFTPFMQLTAAARRELIEDVLDIGIFSTMNQILKGRMTDVKTRIDDIETELRHGKSTLELKKNHLDSLVKDRAERIDELRHRAESLGDENKALAAEARKLVRKRDARRTKIEKMPELMERQYTLREHIVMLNGRIESLRESIHFYECNDSCPTCKQSIHTDFKKDELAQKENDISQYETRIKEAETRLKTGAELVAKMSSIEKEIKELDIRLAEITTATRSNTAQIDLVLTEIQSIDRRAGDVDAEKESILQTARKMREMATERTDLTVTRKCLEVAGMMLKDSGVKTRIIQKYLEPINKMVNKYLAAMDFFVSFELDAQFKETIRSRHRDNFSYDSFSEGEKQRIDLALLFTWREIAKMKNSAATNLLVLDEVFDSSLDDDGSEHVMNLLDVLKEGSHIWVISHRVGNLQDKFDNVVKFSKTNNYSVIEPSTDLAA